jgi:hypothetical protein
MRVLHPHPFLCEIFGVRLRTAALVATLGVAAAGGPALGQDDEARFSGWTQVESAGETRAFKESMRGGNAFDAAARGFLEQIALPQLELEANRTSIERVRKRMREFLLGDIANEKAADEATKTFLTYMESLADKQDADLVVRVNAMLMIGELQGVDRKPLQAAAAVLAKAVSNTKLPQAVRIAACVGLARHVEATKGLVDEQERMAAVANPVIVSILKEATPPEAAVGNDWLASRCLSMLPLLGPAAPATIAEVVRILGDDGRSINVKVRAAAALAAIAGPDSKVDVAALVASIGRLAIVSLERDASVADRILLERQAGGLPDGGSPAFAPPAMLVDPSGQPVVEQLIPREVCRRAAWRLAVLADAILADDSKRGLALLDAAGQPAFGELAQSLRRAAMELDANPDEATLRQALADLKPPAPVAGNDSENNPDSADDKP